MRENIVDILCIGAQKSGTSWLHSMLNIHPRTHSFPNREPVTSTDKEAHFWDWNIDKGVDWYRELMLPRVDPDSKLTMDFTPEYSALPFNLIKKCKKESPTAYVIYILREPVSRAISALRMYYLWEFGPEAKSYKKIELDDDFIRIMQKSNLVSMASYIHSANKWQHFYPDMKIISYDEIKNNPREIVLSIMSDLKLDYEEMSEKNKNEFNKKLKSKVWKSTEFEVDNSVLLYLEQIFSHQREATERKFGFKFK